MLRCKVYTIKYKRYIIYKILKEKLQQELSNRSKGKIENETFLTGQC
jgi:hypothetical protein